MASKKDSEFILEPIKLVLSVGFLARDDACIRDSSVELIKDMNLALSLSTQQNLSDNYLIWQDAIDNAVGQFRLKNSYPDAESFISEVDEQFSIHQSVLSLNYRKQKPQKTNSPYDDFYNSFIGEIYYQLRAVTLQRFVLGERKESFLEKIFRVYSSGFYPCGLKKDGGVIAFNPILLK